MSWCRILIATSRSSSGSQARWTLPNPPSPTFSTSRYFPHDSDASSADSTAARSLWAESDGSLLSSSGRVATLCTSATAARRRRYCTISSSSAFRACCSSAAQSIGRPSATSSNARSKGLSGGISQLFYETFHCARNCHARGLRTRLVENDRQFVVAVLQLQTANDRFPVGRVQPLHSRVVTFKVL